MRPNVTNPPTNLTYGGDYFTLNLTGDYTEENLRTAQVVVHRNGYNTHAMGFGQRMIQLRSSYTLAADGTASLNVQQIPNPGPTLFQPGPAVLYVVIDGVPSLGSWVNVGSGEIGDQPIESDAVLPPNSVQNTTSSTGQSSNSTTAQSSTSTTTKDSGSGKLELGLSSFAPIFIISLAALL